MAVMYVVYVVYVHTHVPVSKEQGSEQFVPSPEKTRWYRLPRGVRTISRFEQLITSYWGDYPRLLPPRPCRSRVYLRRAVLLGRLHVGVMVQPAAPPSVDQGYILTTRKKGCRSCGVTGVGALSGGTLSKGTRVPAGKSWCGKIRGR